MSAKYNIKEFLLSVLEKNSFFRYYYCKNKRLANPDFLQEVERRKHLNIWEYRDIAAELKEYPQFFIPDGNLYGLLYQLYKYADLDLIQTSLKRLHYTYIEHGIMVGDYVNKTNIIKAKKAFTFSEFRKKQIIDSGYLETNQILCIGPYIHYVEGIYDEKALQSLKQSLGKTLLVFPHHSLPVVNVQYDESDFINFIESKKQDFNTVIICLYWADIQKGKDKVYSDLGYRIVCAGNRFDLNFLPRIKTIILLADSVISNAVGTDLGYCVFLKKPVYIFNQEIIQHNLLKNKILNNIYDKESKVKNSYDKRKKFIKEHFNEWRDDISEQQYKIANHFFGFDQIKTKTQIKDFLNT